MVGAEPLLLTVYQAQFVVGVELLLIIFRCKVFHVELLLPVLDQGQAMVWVESLLLPWEGKVKKDVESLLLALDQGQAMVWVESLLLLPQIEVDLLSPIIIYHLDRELGLVHQAKVHQETLVMTLITEADLEP